MMRIHLSSEQFEVGSILKGQVTWTPEKESKPRGLRVAMAWRTEGRGNRKEATCGETERTDMAPGSEVTLPFEFHVPLEGPVSYDGKLMKIIWEIIVQVDLPFARDEIEKKEIRVVSGLYRPENHTADDLDSDDLGDEDSDDDADVNKPPGLNRS